MRIRNLILFGTLFLVCICSKSATAEDIYIYFSTKDSKGRAIDTKVYAKNGDARMEIGIDMAGMKMTTASLVLKKNPNEMIILNSLTKSYIKRVKPKKKPSVKNYTLTVLGKEKVGPYNCTRVRVKSDDKLYDVWCTKELPLLHTPIENNQATIDNQLTAELESKGVSGMMVKTVYFNPGTTVPKLTMQLIKYETKPLSASLFKIPADYKEGNSNDYKNMSPAKKNELMKQMMEKLKNKQ